MSATGRGGPRDRLDRYYTPRDLADALVAQLDLADIGTMVLEPSVGAGAFADAIHARAPEAMITGVDIDPGAPGLMRCHRPVTGDFLDLPSPLGGWDLAIGNPPYRHALDHVVHALHMAHRVAFLLRLGFLESKSRATFWKQWPATHIWALSERPSFTGGGTDATAYGFFLWDQTLDQDFTSLSVLSWKGEQPQTQPHGSNRPRPDLALV